MDTHRGILSSFQQGPHQNTALQPHSDHARPTLLPTSALDIQGLAMRNVGGHQGVMGQGKGHVGTQFTLQ